MNKAINKLKKIKQSAYFWKKAKLSKLKRLVVGDAVSAFLIKSADGYDYLIEPEDLVVGKSLIRSRSYGIDEIQRIGELINLDSNILIVGAHIGTLAIPLSRKVKSVTAIEANPITFRLLKNNILINECKNITPVQIAANDKNEELDFVINKSNSGGSKRLPKIRDFIYFYDRPVISSVQGKSLDEMFNEKFDLVLMDIEGSEYFALKGMQKILSQTSNLIVEFLPHHLRDVAGITVEDFITVIKPHFSSLIVPSKNEIYTKDCFEEALNSMYRLNQSDEGLIFSKN